MPSAKRGRRVSIMVIEPWDQELYATVRFRVPRTSVDPKNAMQVFNMLWEFTDPKRMSSTSATYRKRLKYDSVEDKLYHDIVGRKTNVVVLPDKLKGKEPKWIKNLLRMLKQSGEFGARGAAWGWEHDQIMYLGMSRHRLEELHPGTLVRQAYRRVLRLLETWPPTNGRWPDTELQMWSEEGLAGRRGADRESAKQYGYRQREADADADARSGSTRKTRVQQAAEREDRLVAEGIVERMQKGEKVVVPERLRKLVEEVQNAG